MRFSTVQEIRYLGGSACGPHMAPLMAALLDLEQADLTVSDPDITADITSGIVDVQLTVEADSAVDAMARADAALRAAIHAVGDASPPWETATATMHVALADSLLAVA